MAARRINNTCFPIISNLILSALGRLNVYARNAAFRRSNDVSLNINEAYCARARVRAFN